MAENISLVTAFTGGIFTFLSPCVFPLIPSYISFITGYSYKQLTEASHEGGTRRRVVLNTIAFIAGFTIVFALLGATASWAGQFLNTHIDIVRRVAGAVIVFFGLYLTGIIKLNFLMRERKVEIRRKPAGYLGAGFVGMAFAAGWTPCVGPILGAVLAMAAQERSVVGGIVMLCVYSLGIGIPFLLTGIALEAFLRLFKRIRNYIVLINRTCGIMLIIVGILIYTNYLTRISGYLTVKLGGG
jgi:cytochrome c-type biogenesis protein